MKLLFRVLIFLSFLTLGVHSVKVIQNDDVVLSPKYSSIDWNVTYRSQKNESEKYYTEFMEMYYNYVTVVVDFIIPEVLPHGILTLQENETIISHIEDCIWTYRRLLVFMIILVLQILYLICGSFRIICSCVFCWLSCCCCKKSVTPNKKFRKWLWLLWAYTSLSILLFVLVMAHNSNQDIDRGLREAPQSLENTVSDVITYVETTTDQIETLLIKNFEEYLEFFVVNAEKTTEHIVMDLVGVIENISFTKIFEEIEEDFGFLKPVFDEIEKVLEEIESLGSTINEDLNALKNLASNIPCVTSKCSDIKNLIPSLPGVYDGGKAIINGTFNELGNIAHLGEDALKEGVGEIGNLTGAVGEKVLEEGKALENMTSAVIGNVVGDIGKSGKALANLTSAIGGKVAEEGKALENMTSAIIGNVVGDIGKSEKALANLTSAIGGKVAEEGKALENMTSAIIGNVVGDIGKSEKALANLTSAIGGKVAEEGKALENMTSAIIGNVVGDIGKSEKALANLTSAIGGKVAEEGKALENMTSAIIGNVVGDIGKSEKALANLTSAIGGKVAEEGKALENMTSAIIGNVVGDIGKSEKALANLTSAIGGKVAEEGKALENFTSNLAGHVIGDIGASGKALANLTSGIAGKIGNGGKAIKNLAGNIFGKSKNALGGLTSGLLGKIGGGGNAIKKFFGHSEEKPANVSTGITGNIFSGIGNTGNALGGAGSGLFGKIGNEGTAVKNIFGNSETQLTNFPSGKIGGVVNTVSQGEKAIENIGSNVVGGVANTVSKGEKALENIGSNVVGGVSNTVSQGEKALENIGANVAGGVEGGIKNVAGGIENVADKAKNELKNLGSNIFGGFRWKRGISLNFGSLKDEFTKIFSTVDKVEEFVVKDVKNLKNMTALLSPVIDSVEGIVKEVMDVVKMEIKKAGEPLEALFNTLKNKVSYVEHKVMNATNIFSDARSIIDFLEPFRYRASNVIAVWLLMSFALLVFALSLRMICDNCATKCVFKGGFTLLHLTALLMAFIALIYAAIGVTTQKVFCESLENTKENGIMELVDDINPSKYGLIIDTNLREILHNCHMNESLYDVIALNTVLNLEDLEHKYFNIEGIEKKFEGLLNLQLNFSKFLPMDTIRNIEKNLNFGVFEKIMDSPLFSQIETLENELTHIPAVGTIIKSITSKIDSFRDKLEALKAPVKTANHNSSSFFTRLTGTIIDIEKELISLEENAVGTLKKAVISFKNSVVKSITAYVVDRLIFSIERKVGKCGPLSSAFNSTLEMTCKKITTPANGQWFSWFLGVFISIFIITSSRNLEKKFSRVSAGKHIVQTDLIEMGELGKKEGSKIKITETRVSLHETEEAGGEEEVH